MIKTSKIDWKWLTLIENRSHLYQNWDCWHDIVVGIGLLSTIQFGRLEIRIVEDSICKPALPKFTEGIGARESRKLREVINRWSLMKKQIKNSRNWRLISRRSGSTRSFQLFLKIFSSSSQSKIPPESSGCKLGPVLSNLRT